MSVAKKVPTDRQMAFRLYIVDKHLRFTIDMVLSVELIFGTIGFHLVAVASLRCSPTREKIYKLYIRK